MQNRKPILTLSDKAVMVLIFDPYATKQTDRRMHMATQEQYREFFLSRGFTDANELLRGERGLEAGERNLARGTFLRIRYREFGIDAIRVSLEARKGLDEPWKDVLTIISPRGEKAWSFKPTSNPLEWGWIVIQLAQKADLLLAGYYWTRGVSSIHEIPPGEQDVDSPIAFDIIRRLVDAFVNQFCPD